MSYHNTDNYPAEVERLIKEHSDIADLYTDLELLNCDGLDFEEMEDTKAEVLNRYPDVRKALEKHRKGEDGSKLCEAFNEILANEKFLKG